MTITDPDLDLRPAEELLSADTEVATVPDDPASPVRRDFVESFSIPADPPEETHRHAKKRSPGRFLLQNRTPYLIRVRHDDPTYGELVLPPLAERIVAGARIRPFADRLRLHRQRHEVGVRPYHGEGRSAGSWVLFVSVLLVAFTLGWHFIYRGTFLTWPVYVVVGVAAVLWGAVLGLAHLTEQGRRKQALNIDSEDGDIAVGMGGAFVDGNETARRAFHMLVLILVVTVGAILPAIAILVATDAYDMVRFDGGFEVRRDRVSAFTSRVIQMIYVAILSLFPALLYFQFDRHRVGMIWGHWVRSIFRMDGRMRTLADVHARYGDDLIAASNNSSKKVRFIGGNHSPIVIATILIALGWTVLVLQTESYPFDAVVELRKQEQVAASAEESATQSAEDVREAGSATDAEAALERSEVALESAQEASADAAQVADEATDGSPGDEPMSEEGTVPPAEPLPGDPESDQERIDAAADQAEANVVEATGESEQIEGIRQRVLSTDHFQLLVPRPSAAAMAFLGAYFFGVFLVLRSYFRGDLRPKLYNQITKRLVTVVVLAYLINVLLVGSGQQALIWGLAFFAGIVPQTALMRITMLAEAGLGRLFRQSLSRGRPLSQIDGVDLYDQNVLDSEGVNDVPALANSDLVTVMMRTRLPSPRLVEWADQAALVTVLSDETTELDARVKEQRKRGVRTAWDYMERCGCGTLDDQVHADGASSDVRGSDDQDTASTCATCSAITRLGAWSRIRQWHTSRLANLDRWVPLPEPADVVTPRTRG